MNTNYKEQITNNVKKNVKKLAVFDFDSTLFKSPLPNPEIWSSRLLGKIISDCQWFMDKRTLNHPYLPLVPGNEWWNLPIVEEAKRKLNSDEYLVIMMTGRRKDLFHDRLVQLCQSVGLNFDFYFLKENVDCQFPTTLDYKFDVLKTIFSTYQIEYVDLYDDRKGHVHKFKIFLENHSLPHTVHHVMTPKHEELYMHHDLEKELVFDLVQICNDRINNYRRTQSQKSLSRNTLSSQSIKEEEKKVSFGDEQLFVDPQASGDNIQESTGSVDAVDKLNIAPRHTRFDSLAGDETRKSQFNEEQRNTRKSLYTADRVTHQMNNSCISDSRNEAPPPRRISISMFRKLIELTEEVHYTAIVLEDSSKQRLTTEFKCPESWSTKCERMTICYGKADLEAIKLFGEEGAPVELEATHVSITNQAISCKIKTVLPDMHITVHTHPESKPTEFEWKEISPIKLKGRLVVKKTIGFKDEKNQKKEEVSIGGLIKKHYPSLSGKEIKKFKEKVQEMMSKSFMENCDSNRANIEYYIKTVDLSNIFN
ncbi:hypothetical protein HDV06_006432 [Boothiomyces sp. JEL0866]|nr:hypothetical protein HDV06_006432 [Boothiomyces sp. JEL0866]